MDRRFIIEKVRESARAAGAREGWEAARAFFIDLLMGELSKELRQVEKLQKLPKSGITRAQKARKESDMTSEF